eukprot:2058864-Rhodomonas_salina.1
MTAPTARASRRSTTIWYSDHPSSSALADALSSLRLPVCGESSGPDAAVVLPGEAVQGHHQGAPASIAGLLLPCMWHRCCVDGDLGAAYVVTLLCRCFQQEAVATLVKEFPTLKVIPPGGFGVQDYAGERTVPSPCDVTELSCP